MQCPIYLFVFLSFRHPKPSAITIQFKFLFFFFFYSFFEFQVQRRLTSHSMNLIYYVIKEHFAFCSGVTVRCVGIFNKIIGKRHKCSCAVLHSAHSLKFIDWKFDPTNMESFMIFQYIQTAFHIYLVLSNSNECVPYLCLHVNSLQTRGYNTRAENWFILFSGMGFRLRKASSISSVVRSMAKWNCYLFYLSYYCSFGSSQKIGFKP